MTSTKIGARRSSALKYVEDDLQLPNLLEELDAALLDFTVASEKMFARQADYDLARANHDEYKNERTLVVIDKEVGENPKVSQAAIDRAINLYLTQDSGYNQLVRAQAANKEWLDEAKAAFDIARLTHRTLVTKINAVVAQINYLTASKNASAAAMAQLAGL